MFLVKRAVGHKPYKTPAVVFMGPRLRGTTAVFVAASLKTYASPSVSNIAALIASVADLPAQTTNWNAG
jgi:hypothetical protein